METRTKIWKDDSAPFVLQNGEHLPGLQIAYENYGKLNPSADNAILICHALSGDAHAAGIAAEQPELLAKVPFYTFMKPGQKGWWYEMIGPGKTFDTERYFVVCSNILGSCYGTTGPWSKAPNGQPFGPKFPKVTVRDMVHAQKKLTDHLGIRRLQTVSGGSLGGMQALEWALLYPDYVRSIIPIASAARHSAWAIGLNHIARQAILNDPIFNGGHYSEQPRQGLALARKIGMLSYRTPPSYELKFGREEAPNNGRPNCSFQIDSYLNYQGQKLVQRFDANSYITIINALDSHDVGLNRGGTASALSNLRQPALVIGIDSDILYPAQEQQDIAAALPNSSYKEIKSIHGHDGFLIEFDQLQRIIVPFLNKL